MIENEEQYSAFKKIYKRLIEKSIPKWKEASRRSPLNSMYKSEYEEFERQAQEMKNEINKYERANKLEEKVK